MSLDKKMSKYNSFLIFLSPFLFLVSSFSVRIEGEEEVEAKEVFSW